MPSFKVMGAVIYDHAGAAVARHNGHRWEAEGRFFYRMDCEGPVVLTREGEELSASRDLFAHYSEHDDAWHLHNSNDRCRAFVVRIFPTDSGAV